MFHWQLRLDATLFPDEWQGMGPLRPLHGWSLPRPCRSGLLVGEYSCLGPRVYECIALLHYLHYRRALLPDRLPPICIWRYYGEELCEP